MPLCFLCDKTLLPSIQALDLHYKIFHQNENITSYLCAEPNCLFKKSFNSWSRIRRHYRCFHKFPTYSDGNEIGEEHFEETDTAVDEIENTVDEHCSSNNDVGNYTETPCNSKKNNYDNSKIVQDDVQDLFKQKAAQLLAKFYSNPSFPRSLVQMIVDDVGNFIESSVEEVRQRFEKKLVNSNSSVSPDELNNLFDSLSKPFSSLSSEYLKLKYFPDLGFLIPAADCIVGQRYDFKFVNNEIVKVSIPCTAKLISLRLLLKNFFELPGNLLIILKHVEKMKSCKSVLCSFLQGNLWKEK